MLKKFSIIFTSILVMLLFTFPTSVFALSPSSNEISKGIDVSEWQGDINFKKVKDAGIKVVYIRAGQGFSYEDAKFEENYKNAKENGLKIGVYHYVTARTTEDAITQAKFFASLISNKEIDCKLGMDYEYFGNLTNSQINNVALAYIKELENITGKEVVVYSNTYNAKYTFSKEVAQYPLWVAQYGLSEPQDNGKWNSWEGFQYSSSGKVNGISGNVDLDKYTQDILLEETMKCPSVENPKCNKEDRIKYKVKRGDTLYEIALTHNTTVSHLVQINNIKNPNLIYVGEILIISRNHNTTENADTTYKIKTGDTLSEIALKYNTTVAKLVKLNNISNPNLIYAGDIIKIN